MPNFDEISQSTAKTKLLPVLEKRRPQYSNCTFGFDIDPFIVIGILHQTIGSEVMTSYRFFKMAAI